MVHEAPRSKAVDGKASQADSCPKGRFLTKQLLMNIVGLHQAFAGLAPIFLHAPETNMAADKTGNLTKPAGINRNFPLQPQNQLVGPFQTSDGAILGRTFCQVISIPTSDQITFPCSKDSHANQVTLKAATRLTGFAKSSVFFRTLSKVLWSNRFSAIPNSSRDKKMAQLHFTTFQNFAPESRTQPS